MRVDVNELTLAQALDHHLLQPVADCGAWTLNTYQACGFACRYCIAGSPGRARPIFGTDVVREQLRAELESVPADAQLSVGTICDAYPPVEVEEQVTRAVIEELVTRERTFSIVTKSTGVQRDLDLLRSSDRAWVTVSICSADEDDLAELDLRAPTLGERVDLVRNLKAAGVPVMVSVAPWIPGRTDVDALATLVGDDVLVFVGALNVLGPWSAHLPFNRRFRQEEVDAQYLAAYRSAPDRPNVHWFRPVSDPASAASRDDAGTHPLDVLPRSTRFTTCRGSHG